MPNTGSYHVCRILFCKHKLLIEVQNDIKSLQYRMRIILLRSQLVILTDSVCSELVTGLKKSKELNTRTEGTGGTAAGLVRKH
jgi:hypothetical protein